VNYVKPAILIAFLLLVIIGMNVMSRNADVRKCEGVCDRAVLVCASKQSGATTSTGVLACESLGRMCARKCEAEWEFRKGMVSP
jgi:hypothetical protein